MSETLPLFEALEPASAAPRRAQPGPPGDSGDLPRGAPPTQGRNRRPGPGATSERERHLRAAWRLSRSMWRFPEHSAQQTRAGLAICEHLQALLAEAQSPDAGSREASPPAERADG